MNAAVGVPVAARVGALDWQGIASDLDARGFATTGPLLTAAECATLAEAYDDAMRYRNTVVMAKHGFGRGEYRYYAYPLPSPVEDVRAAVYPHLATVANRWSAALGSQVRYPPSLAGMLERCRAAGQVRPTPLILRYGPDDYNCLHQDLYGDEVFPLQLAILLDEPGRDFSGGEFILVEQRPRRQSRPEVVPLAQGEGVIFAVNSRPVPGARGYYRTAMRHGVSTVRSGRRHTLGVIFHDALG